MLAGQILGTIDPLLAALDHKTPATLPAPLQWSVTKATLSLVNRLDEAVNRKARAASAR
jgi:hypothetical protein